MASVVLQVGVKAFIQNDEGKYLFLQRSTLYPGTMAKKWDIPGGRIEPGEAHLLALAREIKEDTGMTMLGSPEILYAQDILRVAGQHVVRITYRAHAEGEITLRPEEHSDYKWLTIPEVQAMDHDTYLDPVFLILLKGSS